MKSTPKGDQKAEAVRYFTEKGDEYKLDLLKTSRMVKSPSIPRGISPIYVVGRIFLNTGFIKAAEADQYRRGLLEGG